MAYTAPQIGVILLKADRTMYRIGQISYENMFAEDNEALDYERDTIFIYKKAVEYADDFFIGTEKLDKVVERLAIKISAYDYGELNPIYADVSTINISTVVTGSALNDLTDVTITNLLDNQYLRYNASLNQWINVGPGSAVRNSQTFTATAAQTVFVTTYPFQNGLFDLYLNGVKLNSSSYNTLGEYQITLVDGASLNDIIDVVIYDPSTSISLTPAWGSIIGTLSNQIDLQNALNLKYNQPTGTISQYIRGDGSLATLSSGGTWGTIGGTLSNQTDLQNALNAKYNNPTGTTSQYLRGDGSLATFPTIPSGTVSSVGLSMPNAFAVANSPITSSGTLAVTATGDTTQYIAGDGTLIAFPITGQAGTLVREVRNTTGATLTKGTVCYINGASGNKPTVAKALATSDATSAQTFGLIQADIANNSNGYLVAFGDLDGLNTSAFAEGSQLYLSSTTAGTYTTTKQYAPYNLVYIGVVTRQHVNQGRIEVRIQNGFEMDELHNVSAQSPSNNDGLFYNTTTSLWEKKQIATALGFTPVTNARTLTINGVTQDLSANRTFTVPADSTQLVEHLFIGNEGLAGLNFSDYNNGSSGIGATISAPNGLAQDQVDFTINGVNVTIGDRILYINRTLPQQNGLYYYSVSEPSSDNNTPFLTRMTAYDQPSDFAQSILVRVLKKSFVDSANLFIGSITSVTTIGTSEILFTQVDNGRNYGTNANRTLYPLTGKTYFQTDGVIGQYVYNGSNWSKLLTQSVANYFVQHSSLAAYADSTTYYFGATSGTATTTQGIQRGIFNKNGTIKSVSFFLRSASTPTSEAITLRLFKATGAGSLSQIGSTTFNWSGFNALTTVNWTGLSLSVTQGDTYEFSVAIPNMTTNPSNVFLSGNIEVEY